MRALGSRANREHAMDLPGGTPGIQNFPRRRQQSKILQNWTQKRACDGPTNKLLLDTNQLSSCTLKQKLVNSYGTLSMRWTYQGRNSRYKTFGRTCNKLESCNFERTFKHAIDLPELVVIVHRSLLEGTWPAGNRGLSSFKSQNTPIPNRDFLQIIS